MSMNTNIAQGKWREIKGEIQKAWGMLTDDELEKTKGDAKAIAGILQQKYGRAEEDFSEKLGSIFSRFENTRERATENFKDTLKRV